MTKDWPRLSASRAATMRPSVSAVPPGTKGTMMRTGFAGHGCASTSEMPGAATSHATRTAVTRRAALISAILLLGQHLAAPGFVWSTWRPSIRGAVHEHLQRRDDPE